MDNSIIRRDLASLVDFILNLKEKMRLELAQASSDDATKHGAAMSNTYFGLTNALDSITETMIWKDDEEED